MAEEPHATSNDESHDNRRDAPCRNAYPSPSSTATGETEHAQTNEEENGSLENESTKHNPGDNSHAPGESLELRETSCGSQEIPGEEKEATKADIDNEENTDFVERPRSVAPGRDDSAKNQDSLSDPERVAGQQDPSLDRHDEDKISAEARAACEKQEGPDSFFPPESPVSEPDLIWRGAQVIRDMQDIPEDDAYRIIVQRSLEESIRPHRVKNSGSQPQEEVGGPSSSNRQRPTLLTIREPSRSGQYRKELEDPQLQEALQRSRDEYNNSKAGESSGTHPSGSGCSSSKGAMCWRASPHQPRTEEPMTRADLALRKHEIKLYRERMKEHHRVGMCTVGPSTSRANQKRWASEDSEDRQRGDEAYDADDNQSDGPSPKKKVRKSPTSSTPAKRLSEKSEPETPTKKDKGKQKE